MIRMHPPASLTLRIRCGSVSGHGRDRNATATTTSGASRGDTDFIAMAIHLGRTLTGHVLYIVLLDDRDHM